MKFVFDVPPSDAQNWLQDFRQEVESMIEIPVGLYLHDLSYLGQSDGSLDLTRSSACFQLINLPEESVYDTQDVRYLLDQDRLHSLDDLYQKYHVARLEPCALKSPTLAYRLGWVEASILALGTLVGLGALIAGCVLCAVHSRYKRRQKLLAYERMKAHMAHPPPLSQPPIYEMGDPTYVSHI